MQGYPLSPIQAISECWRNRSLLLTLVIREIASRYRGSLLGSLWSFFNPVFMLMVYTFVFSFVFKARWGSGEQSQTEFALILFAGLMVFNLFSECLGRAPGLILSNVNYVKKVVFPIEILPFVSLGSALFHWLISLVVWFFFYGVLFGWPHYTVVLVPIILLPLLLLTLGFSWFLASLGVYIRDTAQVIGIIINTLMFLSPIFYPASALPVAYQGLLFLNPVTLIVEEMRKVLFWGLLPDWSALGIYTICALLTAWLGFIWFQKTRKGFADVL